MPYIAIKGFPKDEETVKKVAERFNDALLELWGCRQKDISISYEAVEPEKWDEEIVRGEVEAKRDRMLIFNGERCGAAKLTIFHMTGCPYCAKARQALGELLEENPAYKSVAIEWIEENEQPEIANRYDYYSVPSIFRGEEKLYEARPTDRYEFIKERVKSALDAVL